VLITTHATLVNIEIRFHTDRAREVPSVPEPTVEPAVGLLACLWREVVPAVGGEEGQLFPRPEEPVDPSGALHDLPDAFHLEVRVRNGGDRQEGTGGQGR